MMSTNAHTTRLKKMCQCGRTECGGTEFCPPHFWHQEKFQTWSKLYPNSLLMMKYYICKLFHPTIPFILEVSVILTHCNNCGRTEFWPLLLPSCHKIKKFQPIKPSHFTEYIWGTKFIIFVFRDVSYLILDSLLGSTVICFFGAFRNLKKPSQNVAGRKYFIIFLNSRNTESVF